MRKDEAKTTSRATTKTRRRKAAIPAYSSLSEYARDSEAESQSKGYEPSQMDRYDSEESSLISKLIIGFLIVAVVFAAVAYAMITFFFDQLRNIG